MGITDYAAYQWEKPHYHPLVTEYQFLSGGAAKYVDLDAGEEPPGGGGGFFHHPPEYQVPSEIPGGHPDPVLQTPPAATTRPWCR